MSEYYQTVMYYTSELLIWKLPGQRLTPSTDQSVFLTCFSQRGIRFIIISLMWTGSKSPADSIIRLWTVLCLQNCEHFFEVNQIIQNHIIKPIEWICCNDDCSFGDDSDCGYHRGIKILLTPRWSHLALYRGNRLRFAIDDDMIFHNW